ncbi:MAG: peptidase S10 [Acidobacteriia bacterium]|nr:peptidase S10 [Terriglobia bacterium]
MRRIWGLGVLAILLLSGPTTKGIAQTLERDSKSAGGKAVSETPPAKEESSVTEHILRIDGQVIPYKATAGTILIKGAQSEPTAAIFYIAYSRSDVKDLSQRPLAFLYNGGPGSSSAWCHMGAFGPRRVVTVDAQPTPPAPYRIEDNANSPLDKADLVFIDPVGTGFSRAVGKAKEKDFWGVDEDVESLSEFIRTFVNRNNRWNSPKFLIGESYGTFRSVALANYLQSREGMYLNGIDLISSVLDLGTLSFHPGEDMPYVFYLPSYAATASYHKILKNRPQDFSAFLDQARRFASTEYADALMKGAKLSAAEKSAMAKKLAAFTGLSEDYLLKANLRVTLGQFREELQRSGGRTTGRLDSRFSGPSDDLLAENATYDPQSAAVSGAFTAAFNHYVRDELKFGGDSRYLLGNRDAGRNWNWKHGEARTGGFPGSPNVMGDLVQAMVANTHLQIQVENGLYDLATPFFATEYTMDHLGLPEGLQGHIRMDYYDAGHMMYLNEESLARLKKNIARFIESASKP